MRRGAVIVIVIWAIAIAAAVTAAVQLVGFRSATVGRETLARVQARWAARAGIEEMIAIMDYHTLEPEAEDALALVRDLAAAADGDLASGSWQIRHHRDGLELPGPMDEHSKLNVNRAGRGDLLNVDGMTLDVVDSILTWREQTEEPIGLGAGPEWYRNRDMGYEPRGAPFRHIAELELVAGVWPERLRGEDWNLNGRLDPNENDRGLTFPNDDGDGRLDAGWSGVLTASSRSIPVGRSGQALLDLRGAEEPEVVERLGVDAEQARALIAFAARPDARLETLLVQDLGALAAGRTAGPGEQPSAAARRGRRSAGGGGTGGAGAPSVRPLDRGQLRTIFNEAVIGAAELREGPGKINVNTASREVLQVLFPESPGTADAIVSLRQGSAGIASIVDLLQIDTITPQRLAALRNQIDVVSHVFTISSRGRAETTGLEVEILVTVDRSTVPAQILMYREP
jgi:type II secretory pathway component PulK